MENGRPVTPTDVRMNESGSSHVGVSLTLNSDSDPVDEVAMEEVWTEEEVQTLKHIAHLETWQQVRQLVRRLFPNHQEAEMKYRWEHSRKELTDSVKLLTTPSTPATNRKRKAPSSPIEVVTPAPLRRRVDSDDSPSTPIPYQPSLTALFTSMAMPGSSETPTQRNQSTISTKSGATQRPWNIKTSEVVPCENCGSRVTRRGMKEHMGTVKCQKLTKQRHSGKYTQLLKPTAPTSNTSSLFKPITATSEHAKPISTGIIKTGSIKPHRGPSTTDSTFTEFFEVLHAEGSGDSTAVDNDAAAASSEYVPPRFTPINAAPAPVKPLTLFQNYPNGPVAPPASPADPSEIARFRVFEAETNEIFETSDADEADETDGFDDLEELMRRMQDEVDAVFFNDEDEQSASVPMTGQSQPAVWSRQHDYLLKKLVRKGYPLEVVKDKHFPRFSLQEVWAKYDNAKRRYDESEPATKRGSSLHWVEPEPHRLAAQADPNVRFRPQTLVSNIKSNTEEIGRV